MLLILFKNTEKTKQDVYIYIYIYIILYDIILYYITLCILYYISADPFRRRV